MLSEWMLDIPEDFTQSWLMKLCPEGKRCLVVARAVSPENVQEASYINI